MSNISKPTDINKIWAASGDKHSPDDAKIALGYIVEIPTLQQFNWMINKIDQAIAHINQHGLPSWDTMTEYQADNSWVQGSNGNLYFCKTTNTNQDPTLDTAETYWRLAASKTGNITGAEQTPSMLNSWTTSTLRYRKFQGQLQIYGIAIAGTVTNGTVLFNLPTAYRPTAQRTINVGKIDTSSSLSPYVVIATNGDVAGYQMPASVQLIFNAIVPL